MIKTQIGVLSTSDVIQLLETNPVTFPHMQDGLSLTDIDLPPSERDYLVIRFNNGCGSSYFNVKYYFSHFPYAINFNTYSGNSYPNYYNIIIPYPEFLNKNPKDPEEVFMRWKSMY
ncbi:MAG: hypothetical protein JSS09_06740 [Verrucomicrobia bacterium]|nr:hypothetical protein [Verrucomicrobiota bacterium]